MTNQPSLGHHVVAYLAKFVLGRECPREGKPYTFWINNHGVDPVVKPSALKWV
jgi:hypothetical protein